MKALILAAALLGVGQIAIADAGGTLIFKGKTYTLNSAYAYSIADPADKTKQSTVIVFGDKTIDGTKIDAAKDRCTAYGAAVSAHGIDIVTIVFAKGPNEPVQKIGALVPDTGPSERPEADEYKLDLKHTEGKRIEGAYRSIKDASKNSEDHGYYDLHFALDVADDPCP